MANKTKTCTKCGMEKPVAQFSKSRQKKDGLRPHCKDCCKAAGKQYYAANLDRERAKRAAYRETHREDAKVLAKRWHLANAERHNQANAQWYKNHPEVRKQVAKAWYDNNREKAVAYSRQYAAENREHYRQYRLINRQAEAERKRLWIQANPEKRAAQRRNRRAMQMVAPGSHTGAEINALYQKQGGRCAYCRHELKGKYHADHIVPLVKGGSNDIGNIQLLCAPCNLRKAAKDPIAFANELGLLL